MTMMPHSHSTTGAPPVCPLSPSGPITTTTTTTTMTTIDAVMMMALEMRAINGHEQAIVRETVEVPYDVNDL